MERRLILPFVLTLFVIAGAVAGLYRRTPVASAFYYWRTTWNVDAEEERELLAHDVRRLYVRFFDVALNPMKVPEPRAPIQFVTAPGAFEIVPVVYIDNTVFQSPNLPTDLAQKVWDMTRAIAESSHIPFQEIQLDSDWTDSTRVRYFTFVDQVRKLAHHENVRLSATIRLHQIKYRERTGVPPVDRGMLMFYNMGKLEADNALSSIYNDKDASRYTARLRSYPLRLDLVLPVFSWIVHSSEGRIVELIRDFDRNDLNGTRFEKTASDRYIATGSFFLHGHYFKRGDLLRLEGAGTETAIGAATLVRQASPGKRFGTVAFFDLDDNLRSHYENQAFADIPHWFN